MTHDATADPRRRPKGDKRARTRAKLLAAARELIREKGYERTTLQDVALRAGMTSGAIYGNFKNRDELFMALADVYWAPIKPEFSAWGCAFGLGAPVTKAFKVRPNTCDRLSPNFS